MTVEGLAPGWNISKERFNDGWRDIIGAIREGWSKIKITHCVTADGKRAEVAINGKEVC